MTKREIQEELNEIIHDTFGLHTRYLDDYRIIESHTYNYDKNIADPDEDNESINDVLTYCRFFISDCEHNYTGIEYEYVCERRQSDFEPTWFNYYRILSIIDHPHDKALMKRIDLMV